MKNLSILEHGKKIIAFGAGRYLHTLINRGLFERYNLVAVVDNSIQKQGQQIRVNEKDVPVISLHDIVTYEYHAILPAIVDSDEIIRQLLSIGIGRENICSVRNNQLIRFPQIMESEQLNGKKGRIFFEATAISENDAGTGIQRVVNNLYKEIDKGKIISLIPIRWEEEWITSRAYKSYIQQIDFDNIEYKVHFSPTDKVLVADSSWRTLVKHLPEIWRQHACTYSVVYDLIPILYSEVVGSKEIVSVFQMWLDLILQHEENILCISKAVADEVISYYKKCKYKREKPLNVYYFHLGFDISQCVFQVRDELKKFVNNGRTFLMVGTVEIRKNHYLILQALKDILAKHPDMDFQLLILGRDGWKNEEFKNMLANDYNLAQHVSWIKNASDAELQWAYQHAEALIFPSIAEGFGLPLVEAAYFGLPILCSDIPVFREVAEDGATYFDITDKKAVAKTLLDWLKQEVHPDSRTIRLYTWQECAKEVSDILSGKVEPYKILQ